SVSSPAFFRVKNLTGRDYRGGGSLSGITELRIGRTGHTSTALQDGRILVVGGENERGAVADAELFDPSTRTFALASKSLEPRSGHTALLLEDGRVLIAGGRGAYGLLASTEIFDPVSNSFSSGPSLNRARAGHTGIALADGRYLIAGGDEAGSAEIFDPASRRFEP